MVILDKCFVMFPVDVDKFLKLLEMNQIDTEIDTSKAKKYKILIEQV
jgi:hypothetical protein